jgi:hypothetical protein
VRLTRANGPLPAQCACCGAPAGTRQLVGRLAEGELWVGSCEVCARHSARHETRRLAAGVAAVLLACALAFGAPIVWPWRSLWFTCALPLAVALWLWLLTRWMTREMAAHAAASVAVRAVRVVSNNQVLCAREQFAVALAALSGSSIERVRASWNAPRLELALIVLLALIAAPASYVFHHPKLRVLNFGDVPFELVIDGHALGRVEPSRRESPFAGLELRVPAGARRLVTVEVDTHGARELVRELRSGRQHLFAPNVAPEAERVCFWLEAVSYGRERGEPEHTLLPPGQEFWVLPESVRGLFAPSPGLADDARVTGGKTNVLRQGACDAPPAF